MTHGKHRLGLLLTLGVSACSVQHAEDVETRGEALLLRDARTCSSGFTYPQDLIDGLSHQLIDELRCMDDRWLEFYPACENVGCVNPYGPQPQALRPEVLVALDEAGTSVNDFITITAGYRDVAMQYYSRWYKENCSSSFNAAIPGNSNHQGGRAIDVRYYDYWRSILLSHGFEHPIPTDEPHFELLGDETFRAESDALKQLSLVAFQRLWNRNNPGDMIDTDGVYGPTTKDRLGNSPVDGFELGGCDPGTGGDTTDTGPADTGATDTGPADAGVADTGLADTGSIDVIDDVGEDLVTADTALAADTSDTQTPDAASPDTLGDDTAVIDTDPATRDATQGDIEGPDSSDDPETIAPDTTHSSPLPTYALMPATPVAETRGCTTAAPRSSSAVWLLLVGLVSRRRTSFGGKHVS